MKWLALGIVIGVVGNWLFNRPKKIDKKIVGASKMKPQV